jgi:hypothetical protein
MFFHTDSATTWLGRGIVWTLCFELLLVAFSPFELALWSTGRGERISRRMEAKRALLDHESPRRRIGRRAVLALGALALPLALIAVGAGSHMAGGHAAVAAPPKVMQVTRVVRVVKPVRVQRVVKIQTVAEQVPTAAPQQYRAPVASLSKPVRKKASTPKRQSAPKTHTPTAHTNVPTQQTAPTTTAPTSTQAPTTQNQSSLPSADQSGAAASPAT